MGPNRPRRNRQAGPPRRRVRPGSRPLRDPDGEAAVCRRECPGVPPSGDGRGCDGGVRPVGRLRDGGRADSLPAKRCLGPARTDRPADADGGRRGRVPLPGGVAGSWSKRRSKSGNPGPGSGGAKTLSRRAAKEADAIAAGRRGPPGGQHRQRQALWYQHDKTQRNANRRLQQEESRRGAGRPRRMLVRPSARPRRHSKSSSTSCGGREGCLRCSTGRRTGRGSCRRPRPS